MILFIDDSPNDIVETRTQFYRMGIHSLVLGTNELHRINRYPAHGILVMYPERIENIEELCRSIRRQSKLPLSAVYRPPHGNYYAYRQHFDIVVEENITTTKYIEAVFDLYKERTGISPYERIYGGLRINVKERYIRVYASPIPVTHEQRMIARYLLLCAPHPVPREELLATCFKPSKAPPSIGNISTQISRMNRKLITVFDRPLFHYQRSFGYSINIF
jgi:hypothetical protein